MLSHAGKAISRRVVVPQTTSLITRFISSNKRFPALERVSQVQSLRKNGVQLRTFHNSIRTRVEATEGKEAIEGKEVEAKPVETEKVTGEAVKHEFQAETRKILDIVARSLYTDKEVFIRELISNGSDALEKLRHNQLNGETITDSGLPFEINIYTDPKKKTLTIQDTGIGMSKEELIGNLGNIGHSGSLDFIKSMKDKNASSADIIGQFGVGFYSAFMVGTHVTVYSRSAKEGSKGYCWSSDGTGTYSISEADGVSRGTKIVISLNDNSLDFSSQDTVERIIKKYSNFVGFGIKLNGKQVNTIKALWTLNKSQITDQEHKEFYQFIAHAYDEPTFHLQYSTDSPINIRSLFYIGKTHSEKFGMGRMESGISLFTRKVLIQPKAQLLPDYLRFIKGVVDSEDLPLNLSREHLQDSALIKRIGNVLTKRILKWLDEESKRDPAQYEKFFEEFGNFLREGMCTDLVNKEDLAKLLRMESSKVPSGHVTSLDGYIERLTPEQNEIFYLCAPSRQLAEASPYYEGFRAKDREVLFLYTSIDDFVMSNAGTYKNKKLLSIESNEASEALLKDKKEGEAEKESSSSSISPEEIKPLLDWIKDSLQGKVSSVKETNRLVDSPAVIVDHDSAAFRRMMKYVDPGRVPTMAKQQLEINPKHPIIQKLNQMRQSKPALSKLVAEQLYDDALVSAGLLDDARTMVPRLNKILALALDSQSDVEGGGSQQ